MRPIFTTLFLGISLSLAACSAAPGDDGVENDEVGQANDELSASRLVGHYYNHQQGPGDFYTLNLEKGGKFTAKVDISDRAFCIKAPCVAPESGTWSSYRYRGEDRIRISVGGGSQTFSLVKTAQTLKLTRSGHSQTLKISSDAVCDTDADCSANEECQQRMCLMYCPAGDPDCCGPATCQPKPSPVQCGRNTCAVGEVCCNPLMGICTPPGGVCAF